MRITTDISKEWTEQERRMVSFVLISRTILDLRVRHGILRPQDQDRLVTSQKVLSAAEAESLEDERNKIMFQYRTSLEELGVVPTTEQDTQ